MHLCRQRPSPHHGAGLARRQNVHGARGHAEAHAAQHLGPTRRTIVETYPPTGGETTAAKAAAPKPAPAAAPAAPKPSHADGNGKPKGKGGAAAPGTSSKKPGAGKPKKQKKP